MAFLDDDDDDGKRKEMDVGALYMTMMNDER